MTDEELAVLATLDYRVETQNGSGYLRGNQDPTLACVELAHAREEHLVALKKDLERLGQTCERRKHCLHLGGDFELSMGVVYKGPCGICVAPVPYPSVRSYLETLRKIPKKYEAITDPWKELFENLLSQEDLVEGA